LRDVLEHRQTSNPGRPFAAATYFDLLPPAGQIPTAALDPRDFTQRFFPAEVDVDLSIIPEDEIPALMEESLTMPPIDLTAGSEAMESTAVLVLVPVSRARFRSARAQLSAPVRRFNAPVPKLLAQRRPLDLLMSLRPVLNVPVASVANEQDAVTWQSLLQDPAHGGLLWYVRRRNVAYSAAYTGRVGWAVGDERSAEERLNSAIADEGMRTAFRNVQGRLTDRANGAVVRILSNPVIIEFPVLLRSALADLKVAIDALPTATDPLNYSSAIHILDPYNDIGIGEGLARVKQVSEEVLADPTRQRRLADSQRVIQLDRLARTLPADRLRTLVDAINQAANGAEIASAIDEALPSVP
jgi:hypothetical protein